MASGLHSFKRLGAFSKIRVDSRLNPLKILQLISSGGYYGAENMLLNLIRASDPAVSQNLLAVFHNHHQPNLDLYHRAVARGINTKLIDCEGKADWRSIREIRRLVREQGIDIVHTHGYKADLYGYLAARREDKPLVATCHNWLAGGSALAAYNFLDRLVLKRFDAVGAVSPAIAERLLSLGVPQERITVIPNGIVVEAFKAAPMAEPRREQVLGIVGRLDLQKGFEYLLRSFATLRHSFPGLRLLIVGEGPDRDKIEQMIDHHSLNSVVTLTGQQTDMPGVYNSIDIFVLPSLNEGLPMTLLEAMAASRPVIATRVGAVPKVITDGVTGLLVEPADEAGLTNAISKLLSAPDLCRALAEKARMQVGEHYTAPAMAQKYCALYAKVMTQRGNKAQEVPTPRAEVSSGVSGRPTATKEQSASKTVR
jgi:glycosyltransferase involved in cell wall biosynthesis